MYSIQASASLRILYILLHFYHYVLFSFKFGIHFAILVLVNNIIIFTTNLYTNHHPFRSPILTLSFIVILSCYEESIWK